MTINNSIQTYRKQQTFTDEQKQKIISYALEHGISSVRAKFNVWPDTVRYWIDPSKIRAKAKARHKELTVEQKQYNKEYREYRAAKGITHKKWKEWYNNLTPERRLEHNNYMKQHRLEKKNCNKITQSNNLNTEELQYIYTLQECLKEFKNIKQNTGNYSAAPANNRIVLTNQQHFYHIERELFKNSVIQEKLISNRQKYLFKDTFNHKELLRGFKISGIHIGYSHFSPLWIKKFIEDTNVTKIYDPCGGWGHRFIGPAACNINYIYNDIWTESCNGIKKIANTINYTDKLTIYNQDCTNFTPQENYDCVFTCPPYYNIEIYNNGKYSSLDEYKTLIIDLIKNSIKPSVKYIGIVINNTYKQIICEAIPDTFKLIQEQILGSTNAISHFNKNTSTKKEILLIYQQT